LRHLNNVSWSPDLERSAMDISATAVDGVRERFRMRLGEPEAVWHFDALLQHVFRNPRGKAATTVPKPQRRAAPAAVAA
jgi:hypothetical protein